MPHLTLEYTNNITQTVDFNNLFTDLHGILEETGGININNCKSRAVQLDKFFIAKGESNKAFVHLDVSFLEGRPVELKQEIGSKILEKLKKHYKQSIAELDIQITVEIKDIRRDVYFKYG
ncbi:5-carboxymethyl-2-hydroxymuconate Delta-isomerase [candidate division KSB1 bacterium]